MEQMVRVKAPATVNAVEWGGERFVVANGHIVIPVRAADFLINRCGFAFPADPRVQSQPAVVLPPAEDERPILKVPNRGRR